jgi:hypothetical protein
VLDRQVIIRSKITIEQMRRTVWYSPREKTAGADRSRDEALQIKLNGGGSPDLVIAAMYAYYAGAFEAVHFPKPPKPFAEGTYGALLGWNERLGLGKQTGVSFTKRS